MVLVWHGGVRGGIMTVMRWTTDTQCLHGALILDSPVESGNERCQHSSKTNKQANIPKQTQEVQEKPKTLVDTTNSCKSQKKRTIKTNANV